MTEPELSSSHVGSTGGSQDQPSMPSTSMCYSRSLYPTDHSTETGQGLTGHPDCLTKNNYNEARCDKLIDSLYECCQAFYEKNGDQAKTVSCPKPELLRLKIKQRKEGL